MCKWHIYCHVMWRWVARMKCILDDDGDGDKNSHTGSWIVYGKCKCFHGVARWCIEFAIAETRRANERAWEWEGVVGMEWQSISREKNDVRQRAQFFRIHDAMCFVLLFCRVDSILFCMSLHGFHVRTCRLTFSAFTWVSSHASHNIAAEAARIFAYEYLFSFVYKPQTLRSSSAVAAIVSRLQLKSRFHST